MSYMTSRRTGKTVTKEELESLYNVMLNNRTLHNTDNTGDGFSFAIAEAFYVNCIKGAPLDTYIEIRNDYGFILTNICYDHGYKNVAVIFEAYKTDKKKVQTSSIVNNRDMVASAKRVAACYFCEPINILTDEEKKLNMTRNKIGLMNPPYGSVGGPVVAAFKSAMPNAKISVLMPISCYRSANVNLAGKQYPLYQFVDKVNTVGGEGFDAAITANNSIITLTDTPMGTTYQDLQVKVFNPNMAEYYKFNISHNINLYYKNVIGIKPEELSIDLDFIDTSRCFDIAKGAGYHAKNNPGYDWNVNKFINPKWFSQIGFIHFNTAKAKINYSKFAYNYTNNKYNCLMSKAICGVNTVHATPVYFMVVPQISWDDIDVRQKTLWDAGDYDGAVLAEMGLKWEGDRIVKA